MWGPKDVAALKEAIAAYDHPTVGTICDRLIAFILTEEAPFPDDDARQILGALRRGRCFDPMRRVAEALLQDGCTSPVIHCLYAQALIEAGACVAAVFVLEQVLRDPALPPEVWLEAQGHLGRAYKQQYVTFVGTLSRPMRDTLQRAFDAYAEGWQRHRDRWHGINAVALAARAARDGVVLKQALDPIGLANELLAALAAPSAPLQHWDHATGAEACLALGRFDDAVGWLNHYADNPACDAFELGSTLRQLQEVWGLWEGGPGGVLVQVLQAALLQRAGGGVRLGHGALSALGAASELGFQRVFEGTLKTYDWYRTGIKRAASVCRVEVVAGPPIGTGCLVRGGDFFPELGDELIVLTNAHVVGPPQVSGALAPAFAQVRFEVLAPSEVIGVEKMLWSSPPDELDATFLRLQRAPTGAVAAPLAPAAEPVMIPGFSRRFYVIGHPRGESLKVALDDNLQVGWQRPYLHYRTATEPGSSGSPVFDDAWQLTAVHHYGGRRVVQLDGGPSVYVANEGVWIHQIAEAIRRDVTDAAGGGGSSDAA